MSEAICRAEIFPLWLEADPSFKPIWRGFLQDWEGERDELPLTIGINAFPRHLA